MKEQLCDWVDRNPPSAEHSFSTRRTAKLFVAVLAASIVAGLPVAFIKFMLLSAEKAKQEQQLQEQQRLNVERHLDDLRTGKGELGEASRMLFGLESDAADSNGP